MVTAMGLQRKVSKMKKEMRKMRIGPAPGMEDEAKPLTEEDEAARQVEPRRARR